MWINTFDSEIEIDEIGFLTRTFNTSNGTERYHLRRRPAHTNRSHEPRLWSWCGETNNLSVYAEGLAFLVRTTRTERALVQRVERGSAEERRILERLGFPELAEVKS